MKSTIDGLFTVGKVDELVSVMETDTYWINRLYAAEALAKLRDPRGWDYLNRSLNSTNPEVREAARGILARLGAQSGAEENYRPISTSSGVYCPSCGRFNASWRSVCEQCHTQLAPPDRPTSASLHTRPGCVTVYAILLGAGAFFLAISSLIGGIIVLGSDVAIGLLLMVGGSALAALEFLIARGLWNMRNWARIIVIILQILGVLNGLLQMFLRIAIFGSVSLIDIGIFILGLAIGGYVIYWFASHGEYFRE